MDQRTALLEAAITCLQERGYARTTTRDIVAAAGAHLPAVNYYFGSKERLLEIAIAEALRRWTQTTLAAARDPSSSTPHDQLRSSLDTFLGSLEANRAYVIAAVEAFAQAPRNDELRARLAAEYQDARREIVARIAATKAGGAGGGVLEEDGGGPGEGGGESGEGGTGLDGVDALASVLLALFDGLALQWLLTPRRVPDPDQVMRALGILAVAAASG